mgnify:CR=1 FL=1
MPTVLLIGASRGIGFELARQFIDVASPQYFDLEDPLSRQRLTDPVSTLANLNGLVVIDEIHAFAPGKRGDLLSLALARLRHIAPGLRCVGLSATIADPVQYAGWLAPDSRADTVTVIEGEAGADIGLIFRVDVIGFSEVDG